MNILLLLTLHIFSNQVFFRTNIFLFLLKIFAFFTLLLLSCEQIFLWFLYYNYYALHTGIYLNYDSFKKVSHNNYFFEVPLVVQMWSFKYKFSIDLFGLVVQSIGIVIGYISYMVLDTRFFNKNIKYLSSFVIFAFIVLLYTTTTNIIYFFLYYELLLLPSFLLVYFLSQARRANQASLYFIIWTQIGSFFVLCGLCYIYYITNLYYFSDNLIKLNRITPPGIKTQYSTI